MCSRGSTISQKIALVCGIFVMILMTTSLTSNEWLVSAGWRQGLFSHCIEENSPTPLPFNIMEREPNCYQARDKGYIQLSATLCIITLVIDTVATFFTALGLHSSDIVTKYKFYRISIYAMTFSLASLLAALIVYPISFRSELNLGNRAIWEFGWAYGIGCGSAMFLFAGIILLICDQGSQPSFPYTYKERKVVTA